MKPIQVTLLFDQLPDFGADTLQPLLEARLSRRLTVSSDKPDGALWRMAGEDLSITVKRSSDPLTPETITQLTNSLVAAPARADLIQSLARSKYHIVMKLMPMPGEGVHLLSHDRMAMLELAHGATATLVGQRTPTAVIWHHAQQALCGQQYLHILDETAPLALFVRARTDTAGLLVEPHADLLDKPIHIEKGQANTEQAYAAGLAFLHHAVCGGVPLPDADSFGPVCGHEVKVSHGPDQYDLQLTRLSMPQDPNKPPGPNAMALVAVQEAMRAKAAASRAKANPPSGRLSTLAAFTLPPLGLALMISNAVMGPNLFRSAMISMASIALALFTASWMVMSERSTLVSNSAIHVGAHAGTFTD